MQVKEKMIYIPNAAEQPDLHRPRLTTPQDIDRSAAQCGEDVGFLFLLAFFILIRDISCESASKKPWRILFCSFRPPDQSTFCIARFVLDLTSQIDDINANLVF